MSLLAAFASLAAQAAEPEPYRAIGTAPLWQAWVSGTSLSFETPGRERLYAESATRQETGRGVVYTSPGLSLSVEHAACTDSLSGHVFADRVTVRVGPSTYSGCGGARRSGWAPYTAGGGEPFWSLEIGDGRLYFGVNDDVWIVRAPRAVTSRDGRTRRYTAPGVSVTLRRQNCELEDERTYADAVTVTAGHWRVEGCGGRVVREAPED